MCTGGVCDDGVCKSTGEGCGAPTECCTGICTGGFCAGLPTTNGTCGTQGNDCSSGADCCSTNCQGGKCIPAYTCHAYGDLCYQDVECCSGMCDAVSGGPGRCIDPAGGCQQDGTPCTGSSNCCTRLCEPGGAGVNICQPASGCRMTGDYCDRTQACCGGSPDAINTSPTGYGIFCDTAGKQPNPPANDSSSKDDYRCSGGQACNPPGNICGGSGAVNASQNCCAGKKEVCKQDLNGIYRCFGGCPNDDCSQCPNGYGGQNPPPCCIPPGTEQANVCQFRDQCCNFNPCLPGADGVLRCTLPPACLPSGTACSGPDDGSCCTGTVCVPSGGGYVCGEPPPDCKPLDALCTSASECCLNNCDEGRCTVPCATSGTCTPGKGDCCSGYACEVPQGSTTGQCNPVSTCTATGASCVAVPTCCDPAATCEAGTCRLPTCSNELQSCSTTGPSCCSTSPALSCLDSDGTVCAPGDTTCICDSCAFLNQTCTTSADCCLGLSCDGTGHCTPCGRVGDICTGQTGCCTTLGCSSASYVNCEADPDNCTCEACVPVVDPAACSGSVCPAPECRPGLDACCGSTAFCGKDRNLDLSADPGTEACANGETGCYCFAGG
jgi:hypothetical protein